MLPTTTEAISPAERPESPESVSAVTGSARGEPTFGSEQVRSWCEAYGRDMSRDTIRVSSINRKLLFERVDVEQTEDEAFVY